ncbi:hypothetical protein CU097_004611 [Rhizopus azygosporus]|uniref:Uncharacterized protein n=1 Tax=Rhizopus azygosporus TaxID=86630 RepID=A0A367IUJ7_RHIAZ|nr:hypothetical protein CU097_004611 [Rhizopus azygosporus]
MPSLEHGSAIRLYCPLGFEFCGGGLHPLHSINMFDSLRNSMQQSQLERNAAFLTTIPILHNLFPDCNDLISMEWIEKQTP